MDTGDKISNDIEIYNDENKYLMRSSLFFLLPGIHGIYRKKYMLSSVLLFGPLVSYKYWSKPRNDIWRNADMICANLGMGLFIGNTAWNIHVPAYKYVISSFYLTGGLCYLYGTHQHKQRNKLWYLYHGAMHAMMWLGHSLNICATPMTP